MTLDVLRTAFHRLCLVQLTIWCLEESQAKEENTKGRGWPAGGETHHKYKPEDSQNAGKH